MPGPWTTQKLFRARRVVVETRDIVVHLPVKSGNRKLTTPFSKVARPLLAVLFSVVSKATARAQCLCM
jgi:hypothetical protein